MKDFIKDYILSQITPTQRNNEINILNQTEQTSDKFGYSFVQCGDYIVFYENSSSSPGMNFYIYDKSMTLIKTENLTDNWITIVGSTLKRDEDGNFYLLGYMNPEETAQGTTYYSLILLNNIIKNTPIIRKWYKLSNLGITTAFDCQKREGSADYLLTYETSRIVNENTVYDLNIVQFTISVQNGNSSISYIYETYSTQRFAKLGKIGYLYNSDSSKMLVTRRYDEDLQMVLIDLDVDTSAGTTQLSLKNGVIFNKNVSTGINPSPQNEKIVVNGISSIAFVDYNNNLTQYNIGDNFSTPYRKKLTDDTLVTTLINPNYVAMITGTSGDYDIKIQKYELTENSVEVNDKYLLFKNTYEYDIMQYLLNVNLINTDIFNLNFITLIFVEIAGSGTATVITTDDRIAEYTDYDSLVPNFVNLYNGNILFSRKLTNESIVGNQMSAEVNVPYSMINRTISVEKLISKTYKVMSNETKIINKNIYESLYLNFIKHINVIDNNFNKNELQNDISSLLAKSIFANPQQNYVKAPIGYAKIFTKDGQELIFSIGQNAITQISQYEYEISIAVNGNNAEKLQILAKDKKTPYVTIPLYSINKVILVKQILKIEEG